MLRRQTFCSFPKLEGKIFVYLFGSWCRWICKVVVERFQSGDYWFCVVSCMLSDITVFLTDGNEVFTREILSQIGN